MCGSLRLFTALLSSFRAVALHSMPDWAILPDAQSRPEDNRSRSKSAQHTVMPVSVFALADGSEGGSNGIGEGSQPGSRSSLPSLPPQEGQAHQQHGKAGLEENEDGSVPSTRPCYSGNVTAILATAAESLESRPHSLPSPRSSPWQACHSQLPDAVKLCPICGLAG